MANTTCPECGCDEGQFHKDECVLITKTGQHPIPMAAAISALERARDQFKLLADLAKWPHIAVNNKRVSLKSVVATEATAGVKVMNEALADLAKESV